MSLDFGVLQFRKIAIRSELIPWLVGVIHSKRHQSCINYFKQILITAISVHGTPASAVLYIEPCTNGKGQSVGLSPTQDDISNRLCSILFCPCSLSPGDQTTFI